MNFGRKVIMHDGRLGVIVGYSSSLGAYNIAIKCDNPECTQVLEWRNDFTPMTHASIIDFELQLTRERYESFNQRVVDSSDIERSLYVGWRDATMMAVMQLERIKEAMLCNK